jgi:hypothetical protein
MTPAPITPTRNKRSDAAVFNADGFSADGFSADGLELIRYPKKNDSLGTPEPDRALSLARHNERGD